MKASVIVDPNLQESEIMIRTPQMSDEIQSLLDQLQGPQISLLCGMRQDSDLMEVIDPRQLIRVYAQSKKVIAQTPQASYILHLPLYQVEEKLRNKGFVRISNSEIIAVSQIACFDASISGTMCIRMKDSSKSYVSRRYISSIRRQFGI